MEKSLIVLCKTPVILKLKNVCIVFAILSLCIGCDQLISESSPQENPEVITEVEASPTDNIHVAFAGGGWRAHTAHTAWTMSLLESNGNKLDNVFEHVNSIGSNSGGSWFSTMLMYSPKFVTDIEKPGALDTWGNTTKGGGWLGGQQKLFDATPCHDSSGELFSACVIEYYSSGETNWKKAVENLVYGDYSLNKITLSSKRQLWATEKPLFLASTMLTNNVVLNAIDAKIYNQYYQACLNDTVNLHGKHGGSCSNGPVPDVTPIIFSSMPKSSNLNITIPPFFPEVGSTKEFHIKYAQQTSDNPDIDSTTIKNPIISDQVQVINAAAASSAAVGFAASKNVSGSWHTSYLADNSALNFSLENGIAQYNVAEDGTTVYNLASTQRVSFADGGPADNSGVAQLMSYLQLNAKDTGFHIVAFDNVQGLPHMTGEHGAEVGNDLAQLFGKNICIGNEFCTGFNCNGYCLKVPQLQIFESNAINIPVNWIYPKKPGAYKNSPRLIYTKYKVTTVANPTFGIKAGSTGYLHAFTCYYDAPVTPQNETKDGSFKAYNDMMHFINDGLKANSNEGLTYLEKAMGLK